VLHRNLMTAILCIAPFMSSRLLHCTINLSAGPLTGK
jgi:hypothetical protein